MDTDEMKEFKKSIEKMGTTWEELKKVNDQKDAEIKKLGDASGETKAKIEKLSARLDEALEAKGRIDALELAIKRGGGVGSEEQKAFELDREIKSAESLWFRKGDSSKMDELIEKKAMSVNSDPDGGYLVTPDTSGRIQKRVYETSPLRQVATVVTISTDACRD